MQVGGKKCYKPIIVLNGGGKYFVITKRRNYNKKFEKYNYVFLISYYKLSRVFFMVGKYILWC